MNDIEVPRRSPRIGERIPRALGVLKAFSIRLPDGPEIGIDIDAVLGPADSGDLSMDLAGLFVELGEVARDNGTGVLITIDELHYVSQHTLEALVMGSSIPLLATSHVRLSWCLRRTKV